MFLSVPVRLTSPTTCVCDWFRSVDLVFELGAVRCAALWGWSMQTLSWAGCDGGVITRTLESDHSPNHSPSESLKPNGVGSVRSDGANGEHTRPSLLLRITATALCNESPPTRIQEGVWLSLKFSSSCWSREGTKGSSPVATECPSSQPGRPRPRQQVRLNPCSTLVRHMLCWCEVPAFSPQRADARLPGRALVEMTHFPPVSEMQSTRPRGEQVYCCRPLLPLPSTWERVVQLAVAVDREVRPSESRRGVKVANDESPAFGKQSSAQSVLIPFKSRYELAMDRRCRMTSPR
eukprot:899711-Rhodomonas_salina.3